MSRTKGSANKNPPAVPDTVNFSTEERLELIASLIVDRILEDQATGQSLLKALGDSDV
jgi:hypothetical protein